MNVCPAEWDTITPLEVMFREGLISAGKFSAASSTLLATWEWEGSSSNPELLTEQAGCSGHKGREGSSYQSWLKRQHLESTGVPIPAEKTSPIPT